MASSLQNRDPLKDTFDFSSLHDVMSSLKRSFWTLDRQNLNFKKAMQRAHTSFYAKILPEKRRGAQLGGEGGMSEVRGGLGSKVDRAARIARRAASAGKASKEASENMPIKRQNLSIEKTVKSNWFEGHFVGMQDEEAPKFDLGK